MKGMGGVGLISLAGIGAGLGYFVGYFYGNDQTTPSDTYSRLIRAFTPIERADAGNSSSSSTPYSLRGCHFQNLFADEAVPGMHLACVQRHGNRIKATIFRDGQNVTSTSLSCATDYEEFHALLEETLGLSMAARGKKMSSTPNTRQPWKMYSPQGFPIESLDDLQFGANDVLIFEGGNFIWPGVRPGHITTVTQLDGIGQIAMRTVSLHPLVFSVDGFLFDHECQHIQARASPHMGQSGVALMDHDQGKAATDWRTSSTYFMRSQNDRVMEGLDKRVSGLTRQPFEHQEDVQVLRYELTQRYDVHHDYFDRRMYSDPDTIGLIQNGGRNRMITVLWYLSDVISGGETIFPRHGGRPDPAEKRNCDIMGGLRVTPKQGSVVMFYSLFPDGNLDEDSLHGSCAVKEGTKWAANKWIWNAPIRRAMGLTSR